jgi:hypothetical protein
MTKTASPRLRRSAFCLSMILSENRLPFFRIMLERAGGQASFVGHIGLCELACATAFALRYRRLSHRVNRTQGREQTPTCAA